MNERMSIVPLTLRQANAFVAAYHRHSRPDRGHKFSIGLERGGEVVGVAIVGRPKARGAASWAMPTAEITRVCVRWHVKNGCSRLYGAARRACEAMGYRRIITYILDCEPGGSLRAAGFRPDCSRPDCPHASPSCEAFVRGGEWSRPSRPREERGDNSDRFRWTWP